MQQVEDTEENVQDEENQVDQAELTSDQVRLIKLVFVNIFPEGLLKHKFI